MRTVRWVRLASQMPMGQQLHESRLLTEVRAASDGEWAVSDLVLTSMRAKVAGSRRVPAAATWSAPYAIAAAIGAAVYGRVDVIHRLDLRCPPSGRREVLTIHDLPPLRFDDEGSLPRWAARSARAAAAVICPSEFAADEVRELLGVGTTRVIPNGVDLSRAAADPLSPDELAELGLAGRLVIHAGGATRRKNLEGLAAAWPLVAGADEAAMLVLCGPDNPRRALFAGLPRARYLGFRPPSFVARLMRSAAAVVVPSTYEGFGLPVLEGMVAGAPVVATSCGALPEVADDAALIVEPTPDAIAGGLLEALAGGARIERMVAAGLERARSFTWERAARSTLAVYGEVLG